MRLRGVIITLLTALTFGQVQAQTITVAVPQDIRGLDIHNHTSGVDEGILVNIFDYLVMRDAAGDIQPALATSWQNETDTTWRFQLREGVTWHDGSPFTADDVKYTLERVSRDNTLLQFENYRSITEVEVVGPHEVIIHTDGPDPILLSRLTRIGSGMLPYAYIEEVGFDQFMAAPIGTGPYRFVEWRRDDRIVLEAFNDHWRGVVAYEQVVFRPINEPSTRINELLSGGVQIAISLPPQDSQRVQNDPNLRLATSPATTVMQFLVNTGEGHITADPRVREAIDLAIDNQALVDALFDGLGTPTRARVTPGLSAAPQDQYDTYLYDPERAVELLAEAGYGPGEANIHIQGPAGRYAMDSELAELVGVFLEMVGFNVTYEILESSVYIEQIYHANRIENLGLIGLGNDSGDYWYALRGFLCDGSYIGKTNWCNERFDELVESASVNLDPEERAAQLAEASHILTDDHAAIFLYQLVNRVGINESVDWTPRADENYWMFEASPAN